MALTYRTPMEDIVSSFEPAVQSSIASKAALGYKHLEEENFQIANYHLKPEAKLRLSSAGIYLSPFSAVVHSHPVCKTLENHILYTVLPNYVNNKFYFVGIKNSKLHLLKSRNPHLELVQLINRYVTSKDKIRYSNDFVMRSSAPVAGLCRHKAVLADVTLKDLVPNILNIKSKHLFLHDELHYWREKDLITFLEAVQPETLLGTVVFPPELLIGAKSSLNPWCYQFEVQDGNLLFFPDGERTEGYEQPLRGGYLLTTNEIHLPNGEIYCVDLLCSKFAHHLFSITRGSAVTCKYRSFGRFEAVSFAGLLDLSPLNQPYLQVSFDVVSKLYRYLRSLKKPDLQSAMAKLSQIVPEPTSEEIKFTQEFAELVINSQTMNSIISVNRLQTFITRLYRKILPKWCLDKMACVRNLCLDDFISALRPLSVTKKLKRVDLSTIFDMNDWTDIQCEEAYNLIDRLDDGFIGPNLNASSEFASPSLRTQPYVGLAPLTDLPRAPLLIIPNENLIVILSKRVLQAVSLSEVWGMKLIDLKAELEKVLSRRNLIIPIEHCLKDQMLKAVLSRIKALTVKYNKTPFVNNNCNWFTSGVSHRVNRLFLTNFEEQPAVSLQLKRNWGIVCQDILHQSLSLCGNKLPFLKRAPSKVVSHPVEEEVSPTLIQATKEILGEFNLGDLSPKTALEILRESGQSKFVQDEVETESSESLNISITGSANEGLADSSEPIEKPVNEECGPILIRTCYDGRVRKHFNLIFEVRSAVEAICLKLGLLEKEVVKLLGSIEYNAAELFPQNEHVLIDLLAAAQKRFRTDLYLIFESSDEKYSIIRVNKGKNISYEVTLMLFVATSEVVWVVSPKNLCVVDAIASALGREVEDVLRVLNQKHYRDVLQGLLSGQGLDVSSLSNLFKIFSIRAEVEHEGQTLSFNDEGTCCGFFKLIDDHLEFVSDKKSKVGSLLTSGRVTQRDFESSVLLEVGKIGSCVTFTPKYSRAKLLADCLHTGNTGVITSELFNGKANLSEAFNQNFIGDQGSKQVYAVLGTFGVGKSSVFRRLTSQARGQCFDFVSPRKALLNEIREEVGYAESKEERRRRGQMAWSFSTFEKFLSRVQCLRQNQVVFLDEVQLYPNGYLDLIFALAKVDFNLIVFGDPCQSDYDNERDRSYLSNITSNIDSLLKGKEYKYNILSYRFENPNFVGRLPCSFAETRLNKDAQPYLMYNDLEQLEVIPFEYTRVVLVSSFEEKRIVSSYCPSVGIVLTFGESTGLNFDFGTILITLISERTSEKRWVTALSRFKKNLALVNATGYSMEGLATSYKTRFLGRFLTGTADVDDLKGFLPGSPIFIDGFPREIGKNEGIREEKLIGDPWLKCMIDLFQLEDLEVVEAQDIQIQSENFKIHLPMEELEGTRARWVHRILNKEFREVRLGSIVSDQFTDDHSKQKGGMQLTNAAERFETIYPRHRANDTVTFIMAVKKRLRFSKPHLEASKLNHAKPFGRYLLNEFLKKVPLKRAYDVPMMEEARQDFFDKKTSKSAATIENHNVRSCRDWLADIVQVFSKSQICTKFDNRFRSAKAAQSIACFQHSVLCRFAPYMRYIEKKLHEALPEKFYIHSGKSLEQLNNWVIRGKFDGVCTESDYEAFDASQDQYIVAFELEVMKHLGLPNDLIKDYIYIKTHLGSKLGNFAIMRFTGEASTFLFNTMANMLFTFLRYNLHGDERICFAGDDMCSSKRLRISNSHEGFLSKIKLKAKVQHTNKPTFCGWHLCPDGIYKKPQLVFERMCIAKETNNLQNCIDSYAIEVSYAYKMGERVFSRMDEEEIGAYYGCVRTIIKYKHLLKSEVRALYESLE